MPVVPCEVAPAVRPPARTTAKIFTTLFLTFERSVCVGLNVTMTTKKVVNFLGEEKCTLREKQCTHRENPGYAYEKRAPALRSDAPRMVNPALVFCAVVALAEVYAV